MAVKLDQDRLFKWLANQERLLNNLALLFYNSMKNIYRYFLCYKWVYLIISVFCPSVVRIAICEMWFSRLQLKTDCWFLQLIWSVGLLFLLKKTFISGFFLILWFLDIYNIFFSVSSSLNICSITSMCPTQAIFLSTKNPNYTRIL